MVIAILSYILALAVNNAVEAAIKDNFLKTSTRLKANVIYCLVIVAVVIIILGIFSLIFPDLEITSVRCNNN